VGWTEDGVAVALLDQSRLPLEEVILRLEAAAEVAEAIRSLRVRGAPAIGVAAAYGVALGMSGAGDGWPTHLQSLLSLFRGTRPTGRNLFQVLERLEAVGAAMAGASGPEVARALRTEAERVREEDAVACRSIGEAGVKLLPPEGAVVLTHCNAGALATGGVGTALAPVYLARERGIPVEVVACEARPVLQGSRLTAWELMRAGVPVTLITDGMAGARMAVGGISAVVVGADRIAADGSTANKVGTYALALLAREHGIPFYVAAPATTVDLSIPDGRGIRVEERAPAEVRGFGGGGTAPPGVAVWNPAFDITPPELITAFITDGGVIRPPFAPGLHALASPVDRSRP